MSTATDIYSLGAVLYHLLTGASPHRFGDNSAGTIASTITTGRIIPAGEIAPELKGDLEAILMKAREMHLGGATVLRGHAGFGHSSRLHTTKILRLSEDLPVVVEIIDSPEKIEAFLPILDGMMSSGLVTSEKVQVLQYGTASPGT